MEYVMPLTLKSWTPMQANMNWRSVVTIMMLPMVRMATNTHWTTCCTGKEESDATVIYCDSAPHSVYDLSVYLRVWWWLEGFVTFRPLALLMALRGRSTRSTRRIFTTDIAEVLHIHTGGEKCPGIQFTH